MTATPSNPVQNCQPICATPPEDLIDLADSIDKARSSYLDAVERDSGSWIRRVALIDLLWNDKGTFAPALRQAAEAATLTARVEELEKALQKIADLPERDNPKTPLKRTPRQIALSVLQPKGAV